MASFNQIVKNIISGNVNVKQASAPFVSNLSAGLSSILGNRNGKYLEEYRNWVFACVQARAEEVGNIELSLMKGDVEIEKHELLDLLNGVNPTMTKQDLFFGTQAYLDLEGNAFWFLARDNNGKGKVREIWLLRPDRVSIVPQKDNPLFVAGYTYKQQDGTVIPFGASEILHFKNFNPLGNYPFPHRGVGIVETASWSIDTDNEARQWNFNFFKNSARPDGVLQKTGEGTIGEDEYKRLKQNFEQNYQGSGNSHKVLILTGGLEWKELARSQKEMDFIEQRRMSRDEILAMFRVPKSVIGIVEDVNRANAEASNYIFALRTVDPLMKKIVSTLNEFLVSEFDSNLKLAYESPVPEDRVQELAEYTAGVDKWLTRNEIRAEEGLPPIEGGDTLYGQFSNVPIGTVTAQNDVLEDEDEKSDTSPVIKIIESENAKSDEPSDTIKGIVDDFVAKLPATSFEKKINQTKVPDEARKAYLGVWKAMFDINDKPLIKKINGYFNEQESEVLANLRETMKGLEVKEFKTKAIEDVLFNEKNAVTTGIALITPFIKNYIEQSGGQAMTLTGNGLFDVTTPSVAKFITDRSSFFAKSINQTTYDKLVATLKEGTEAGEDLNSLADRVSKVYGEATSYRSTLIARTEISASANFGSIEAYKQADITSIEWAVVNPQDEDCVINDGAVVSIGSDFPNGDGAPPVHPNCECTTLPVFN